MVRSNWKGKYTPCDYTELMLFFDRIPLSKLNIYLFSIFRGITFDVYNRLEFTSFIVENIFLGFKIGCFFFSREINVIHNQKKSKKVLNKNFFLKKKYQKRNYKIKEKRKSKNIKIKKILKKQ